MRSLLAAREEARALQRDLAKSNAVALSLSNARIGERQQLVRLASERQKAAKEHVAKQMKDGTLDAALKEMLDGVKQRLSTAIKQSGLSVTDEKKLLDDVASESSRLAVSLSTAWADFASGVVDKVETRALDLEPIDLELHARLKAELADSEAAVATHDEVATAAEGEPAVADSVAAAGGGGGGALAVRREASSSSSSPPEEACIESTASALRAVDSLALLLDLGEVGDAARSKRERTAALGSAQCYCVAADVSLAHRQAS